MDEQALQYYMHDGPTAFRFELAGNLYEDGARRLDQDWRTASSVIGDRHLIVDLTFVTDADEQGRELLARWHREGAKLVANSKSSRELAETIIGQPLPEPAGRARNASRFRTWLPFRTLFMAVAALVCGAGLNAATLKPEAVAAWNSYVNAAHATLLDRVHGGGRFLWTFENSERAARVRAGEIVVEPASAEVPRKVPGGLIHHWIGAAFIPNLKLDDVLAVVRDYDKYKEFYRPSVMDSKVIAQDGADERFSMVLMNKAFFLKTALDADYHATVVRPDACRAYMISNTTRVQEIEDYGRAGEHRLPQGQGGGYIWKLYSIARLEQRDGGVYVELEAMALSRDVPAMLRLVVDPIVRRVSRNTLLTSLEQTEQAVRGGAVIESRMAAPRASLSSSFAGQR